MTDSARQASIKACSALLLAGALLPLATSCGPAENLPEASSSTPSAAMSAVPSSLLPSAKEIEDSRLRTETITILELRGATVESALRKIGVPEKTSLIKPEPILYPVSCSETVKAVIDGVPWDKLIVTGSYAGLRPNDQNHTLVLGVSPVETVNAIPGLQGALESKTGSKVDTQCGEQLSAAVERDGIFGPTPVATLHEVPLVG